MIGPVGAYPPEAWIRFQWPHDLKFMNHQKKNLRPNGGFSPEEYANLTPEEKAEAMKPRPRTAKDFAELAGCKYEAESGEAPAGLAGGAPASAREARAVPSGAREALEKYNPAAIQSGAPSSWAQVKYWVATATKGAMVSVAAQVMTGFCLIDLRKEHGTNQGKRRDLTPTEGPDDTRCDTTSPSDLEKLDWPDLVKKFAGVSDETARNWMRTAADIKRRWKKIAPEARIRELIRLPVSDWSEADTKLVFEALVKAIDGATMIDFMRELGLAKQLARGTGREPGCDGAKRKLTLSEEAALRQEQARVEWQSWHKASEAYKCKFLVLTDEEVTAQIAELEQALKPRREWLKQPLNQRNPKVIEDMFA